MNIKFTVEYKGTNYCGWQIQKDQSTIQGELTNAFQILFPNEKINIIGSGRTDTGVHAYGQVGSVQLPDHIELVKVFKSINGIISHDIFIKDYEIVNNDFNARYSAKTRMYQYFINQKFSPFTLETAWYVNESLNYELLEKCASLLIGEHDFSSFSKHNPDIINKNCTIFESFWDINNDNLIFTIKSNRFLHHMVRFIVGSSIEVAKNKINISDFSDMINNVTTKSPLCAPSKGLFLYEVLYD